jgi:hypothetical protein
MRFYAAVLFILALPAAAFAQARGQVLGLGFNNHYRPDCWTPLLIQLTSQSAESQVYQIQIVQEDLDYDRVSYVQTVTLGGNVEGKPATTENFWVYFKPKPVDGGLPDATDLSATLNTLNSQLKVFLCDKDGKQIATLPMTATILNVDPPRTLGDTARSRQLILFVTDGADKPEISDYSTQKGVLQDIDAVAVSPRDLPSNVIGYEAVDAIVWMDADANFLISGTRTPALEAIRQWVHQGGNLVVCQPAEPLKIQPFADMLPVGAQLNGQWTIPIVDRKDADVLRRLAHPIDLGTAPPDWPNPIGPLKIARVPPLDGTKVDEWMAWTDDGKTTFTPWLARRGIGLGVVTWVAQDLGNPALTEPAKGGWRYIWDRVFDWNNPSSVPEDYKPEDGKDDPWINPASLVDLGTPFRSGMDLTNKAVAMLSIAGFFFVIYWVVAGPGIYLFLVAKKRAHLSWFFFGLSAVVATALTALVVKLVVRGPPELRHVSFVRYAAGENDGVVDSRFGLYIPQDGPMTIALKDTAPQEVSDLAPYSLHPMYASNSDSLSAYQTYQVPVRDPSDSEPVSVTIPYRSTSKKLQAHWVGELKPSIDVDPRSAIKLDPDKRIVGSLVNHTGYDLSPVFLAFKQPPPGADRTPSTEDEVTLVYVDNWPKDTSIALQDLLTTKNRLTLEGEKPHLPMGKETAWASIGGITRTDIDWGSFWRSHETSDDDNLAYALSMLMVFDHLPPWASEHNGDRFELYRRGARRLDMSPAISAGNLAICASALVDGDWSKSSLPIPLTVSDSPVAGLGTTIFQFVLPLDRSAVYGEPTTQPTRP